MLCTLLTLLLRQGDHTEHAAHVHEHDAQAAHVVVQHVGEGSQAENHDRGGRYGAPGSPAESHAGGAPEHAQNRGNPCVDGVHGEVQLADAHHAQLRGELALVLTGEGVFAGGVNAQLTDRGGAADILGQHAVEVTHALLGGLVACRHERQHLRHDEGKTGNHGQHDQAHCRAHERQGDRGDNEVQHHVNRAEQVLADGLGRRGEVVGYAGEQVAAAGFFHGACIQVEGAVEGVLVGVTGDECTQSCRTVRGDHEGYRLHDERRQNNQNRLPRVAGELARHHVVHGSTNLQGHHRTHEGADHVDDEGVEGSPLMRREVVPHAACHVGGAFDGELLCHASSPPDSEWFQAEQFQTERFPGSRRVPCGGSSPRS